MAKITFDAFQYEQDKAGFFEGLLYLIESFFGKDYVPELATFASPEKAKFMEKTHLEKALDALPELVFEGKWDINNGELTNDLDFWLRACEGLLEVPNVGQIGSWSDEFEQIIKTAHARTKIHCHGTATIEEIALLADMSVGSVKNAQYAKDDGRLVVENDGYVASEEAWRWLRGRRNFKPTRFYDSRFGTLEQLKELKSIYEVRSMLRARSQFMKISAEQISEAFNGAISIDIAEQAFCRVCDDVYDDQGLKILDLANILEPTVCINLAKLLNLDTSWFVLTATKLAAEAFNEELIRAVEANAREALAGIGLPHRWSLEQPVDPEEIPTADKIRQMLTSQYEIAYHPKFKKGNAKIEAYLLENGRAIAHEYNLRNQALWIRTDGLDKDPGTALLEMIHSDERIPHSGLTKYPELAEGHLMKFFPRSMAQVAKILEVVMNAAPINDGTEENA